MSLGQRLVRLVIVTLGCCMVVPAGAHAEGLRPGQAIWSSSGTLLAVGERSAYVVGPAGTLVATDLRSGATRWTAPLDGQLGGVAAAEGPGTAYVAIPGPTASLRALDAATGAPRWSRSLLPFVGVASARRSPPRLISGPAVIAATVVLALGDDVGGEVIAGFDPDTGVTRWRTTDGAGGPVLGQDGIVVYRAVVAQHDRRAGAGTALVARDPLSGRVRWRSSSTGPIGALTGDLVGGPSAVYARSTRADGTASLSAYDVRTGARRWSAAATTSESLITADGGIVVTGELAPDAFIGRDADTGVERWRVARQTSTPQLPVVALGRAFVPDGVRLRVVGSRAGTPRWDTPISGTTGVLALRYGVLFSARDDGTLVAYDTRYGSTRWTAHLRVAPTLIAPSQYVLVAVAPGTVTALTL